MSVLEIRNISKSFTTGFINKRIFKVLKDISFSVEENEILGLAGTSGAGKSTLIRIIMQLLKPDQGEILLNGKVISQMSANENKKMREDMQLVFQNPTSSLNPRMTIKESIEEPIRIHKNQDINLKHSIEDVLEKVQLRKELLSRYPHQLSGGELQRICLARLLLCFPRILMAALVGAGLAVSGVVMQAIVRNPLADPYILGISSGASLGATVAILFGLSFTFGDNSVGIMAFMGAFAISLGVIFIANMGGRANSTKLLLAGLALSAVCSSFTSLVVYFANNKEAMQSIAFWMMGSMAGATWGVLKVLSVVMACSILFLWLQSRMLNLMLVGDEAAITLGYDLNKYRQIHLLVSSLIVGFAVYSAGIIGFVGLLVPHVVRLVVGTGHIKLIPFSALVGAIFLVIADALCRILLPHAELPIGILISVIGAPFFVFLIVKRTYSFGN